MKLNKKIIAVILSGCLIPNTYAEESIDTSVTAEIKAGDIEKASDKDVVLADSEHDTLTIVEDKLERYVLNIKRKLVKQNKAHKVFVYTGTAEINVDKSNPNWSKFRERALESALLNARKDYLETLNTSSENSIVSSFSKTNGLPKPTISDFKSESKMDNFLGKVIGVLDGKLDQELDKMGIDSKQFNAAPPSIKRDLYKEAVVDLNTRSSYGDLSGMTLVKLYEEIKDSGQGTIGVVMLLSAKKRDQIKALVESNGQVSPDTTRINANFTTLDDFLYAQKDSLYLKSGTQVIYDAQGLPMILVYGQSGIRYASSSSERKIERKTAKRFAVNNAWANFSRVYNLSGEFSGSSSTEVSSSKSEQFDLISDSIRTKSSGLTESLIERIEEKASMSSSLQGMTGVSIEFDWRRKHPITGHEMAGTVLVWHPTKIQHSQNLLSGKSEAELDRDVMGESNSSSSFESEDMFDAADF
uniref:DUF6844 domain-containing protein n=1 Tax=Aliivibrio wodanis TaxID=80852 RepID=A0A5Q4ZVB7_9GAMM|nr:hypothetical protein AW0309160_03230 [Aliivibrio wodanis]